MPMRLAIGAAVAGKSPLSRSMMEPALGETWTSGSNPVPLLQPCRAFRDVLLPQPSAPALSQPSLRASFINVQRLALLTLILLLFASGPRPGQAQGVLTVTPGRSIVTTSGSGRAGYTGDAGLATAATLARPSGIAYDSAGNAFVADANNHVVREVNAAGIITTVAGTGVAGYGGDHGPALSAFLDTPTGVALDAHGNLYIADSHNNRIRQVSNGTITTVAGTGTAGFSGDAGAATGAQLALPSAVAVDVAGNLFIADTNNHRIRKLEGGLLTTVAGNGEELFAGDGGPARAAALDQPTGIAVDAANNLFIADKNNHRVRMVNAAGVISTVAGNGAGGFSGAYAGEAGDATGAALAKPAGVSVDAAGNLFIADTNNHRVREVSPNGAISTLAGIGEQGFGGDAAPAPAAQLNSPRAISLDGSGNILIADTQNQRLRTATLGQITFATQPVAAVSGAQTVTLSNTGTAPLTLSSLRVSGPFAAGTGGTCPPTPVSLQPGMSCTEAVVFAPVAAGAASGFLSFTGPGLVSQTLLLAGTASIAPTSLLLTVDKTAVLAGEPVTLTATLTTSAGSTPLNGVGTITFYAGTQPLGSAPLVFGKATLTFSSLPTGAQALSAVFAGNSSFTAATSSVRVENVADLRLALSSPAPLTLLSGQSMSVPLLLFANGAAGLTSSVSLGTLPLPPGLTATFTPASAALANGTLPFAMQLSAAPATAFFRPHPTGWKPSGITAALLLVPLIRRRRLAAIRSRFAMTLFIATGFLAIAGSLTGCAGDSGYFFPKQQSYTITVTATANDTTGGTLTRTMSVPLTVE